VGHVFCVVSQDQPWSVIGSKRDLGVCVRIQDDAAALDEFIAFHWVQGAARFVVFDDGSVDDPASVLEKYSARGIVEYKPAVGPEGLERQCLDALGQHEGLRWALFPGSVRDYFLAAHAEDTLAQVPPLVFGRRPRSEGGAGF
jgi:hypothetical protein